VARWQPTLREVAAFVSGRLVGAEDPERRIRGIAPLDLASGEELSFLTDRRKKKLLSSTQAAAVLVAEDLPAKVARIVVADPYLAYARLQQRFFPRPRPCGLRHPSAVIEPGAEIAEDVDIGPCAVVLQGARIDEGTIVGAGCVVGRGARIGRNCILHPRAVVLDADGFGFAWAGDRFEKIPQVGRVVIGNDVEIGANACIDRGALADTVIEDGVKIDNLVQIGHNATIGAHTAMAAQAGVSGSTRIGRYCLIGGQAGFAGHLKIADRVRVGAQAGVIGDLDTPGEYWGTPAVEKRRWLRAIAALFRLAEKKRLKRGAE